MASLVGSRVERKEDARFLTGKGRYTADINIAKRDLLIRENGYKSPSFFE